MKKRVCCIFTGGEIKNYDDIEIAEHDYVICADSGYSHAINFKIKPDCIIGDFDSLSKEIYDKIADDVVKYPAEKDDTDTMLAIKLALQKKFDIIYIYGAGGGRTDHLMANIQSVRYAFNHGAECFMITDNDIITIQSEGIKEYEQNKKYHYFSILSLTNETSGVTIKGFKYPLNDALLTADFPLGVSNQMVNDIATVEIKSGLALIMYSKDNHQN